MVCNCELDVRINPEQADGYLLEAGLAGAGHVLLHQENKRSRI
jgi:hypothetical protein